MSGKPTRPNAQTEQLTVAPVPDHRELALKALLWCMANTPNVADVDAPNLSAMPYRSRRLSAQTRRFGWRRIRT